MSLQMFTPPILLFGLTGSHVCLDVSWNDRVDPHTQRTHFTSERAREACERSIRVSIYTFIFFFFFSCYGKEPARSTSLGQRAWMELDRQS